jgi:hypothetical protein
MFSFSFSFSFPVSIESIWELKKTSNAISSQGRQGLLPLKRMYVAVSEIPKYSATSRTVIPCKAIWDLITLFVLVDIAANLIFLSRFCF